MVQLFHKHRSNSGIAENYIFFSDMQFTGFKTTLSNLLNFLPYSWHQESNAFF